MEADKVGLELMANAGYDVRQTVDHWMKVYNLDLKGRNHDYVHCFPMNEKRMQNLTGLIDKAVGLPADDCSPLKEFVTISGSESTGDDQLAVPVEGNH